MFTIAIVSKNKRLKQSGKIDCKIIGFALTYLKNQKNETFFYLFNFHSFILPNLLKNAQ